MKIDIESVLRYVEVQKDTMGFAPDSPFKEGVLQGLILVEEFCEQFRKGEVK